MTSERDLLLRALCGSSREAICKGGPCVMCSEQAHRLEVEGWKRLPAPAALPDPAPAGEPDALQGEAIAHGIEPEVAAELFPVEPDARVAELDPSIPNPLELPAEGWKPHAAPDAAADTLRRCTICGFIVDLRYAAEMEVADERP